MLSGLRSLWTLSGNRIKITETVDIGHRIEELPKKSDDFKFADFGSGVLFKGASIAELEKTI